MQAIYWNEQDRPQSVALMPHLHLQSKTQKLAANIPLTAEFSPYTNLLLLCSHAAQRPGLSSLHCQHFAMHGGPALVAYKPAQDTPR